MYIEDIKRIRKEILNKLKEKYDSLSIFREGIAITKLNNKYGFVNEDGEEITECIFDEVDRFDYKFFPIMAPVKFKGKWGYINKLGKNIIPCIYDDICNLGHGLIGVSLDGKWGVIDENKRIITHIVYEYLGSFLENYAKVKLNGKYGFIDREGINVLPCNYDYIVSQYSDVIDLLEIKNSDDKYGFINKQGEEIIPCKYDMIICIRKDLYKVKVDNKWGLLNLKENYITDIKYSQISDHIIESDMSDSKLFIVSDNKTGIIDEKGEEIVPLNYMYLNQGYSYELIEAVIEGEDGDIVGFIDLETDPLKFIPFDLSKSLSNHEIIKYTKYNDDYVIRTKRNIYYLYDFESYVENKKYILKERQHERYMNFINELTTQC